MFLALMFVSGGVLSILLVLVFGSKGSMLGTSKFSALMAAGVWWAVLVHFLLTPDLATCSRFADVISCALLMLVKQ